MSEQYVMTINDRTGVAFTRKRAVWEATVGTNAVEMEDMMSSFAWGRGFITPSGSARIMCCRSLHLAPISQTWQWVAHALRPVISPFATRFSGGLKRVAVFQVFAAVNGGKTCLVFLRPKDLVAFRTARNRRFLPVFGQ